MTFRAWLEGHPIPLSVVAVHDDYHDAVERAHRDYLASEAARIMTDALRGVSLSLTAVPNLEIPWPSWVEPLAK